VSSLQEMKVGHINFNDLTFHPSIEQFFQSSNSFSITFISVLELIAEFYELKHESLDIQQNEYLCWIPPTNDGDDDQRILPFLICPILHQHFQSYSLENKSSIIDPKNGDTWSRDELFYFFSCYNMIISQEIYN